MDRKFTNTPNFVISRVSDTDENTHEHNTRPVSQSTQESVSYDEDFDPNKTYPRSPSGTEDHTRVNENPFQIGILVPRRKSHGSTFTNNNPFRADQFATPQEEPSFQLGDSFQRSPIIHGSLDDNDLKDLQEGLKFALGTNNESAKWFPVTTPTRETPQKFAPINTGDDSSENANYTSNIPLQDLDPLSKARSGDGSGTSLHSPSPFVDYTETTSTQNPRSPSRDMEHNLDYLEAGLLNPNTPIGTPANTSSKFTDAIARISNRVAGTGHKTDGHSDNDHLGLSPARSRGSSHIKTPVNEHPSFMEAGDHSFRNSLSPGKGPKNVPELTVTTDKGESVYNDTKFSHGLGVYLHSSSDLNLAQSASVQDTSTEDSLLHERAPSIHSHQTNGTVQSRTKVLHGKSLGIFPPNSILRRICHSVLENQLTTSFLLLILVFQVILLSYRQWNPHALDGYYYSGYNWADYLLIIINIIYTVEIVMQVIAYGLVSDRVSFEELGVAYPPDLFDQTFLQMHSAMYLFKKNLRNPFKVKKGSRRGEKTKQEMHDENNDSSGDDQLNYKNNDVNGDRGDSFERLIDSRTSVDYDLQNKYEFSSFHDDMGNGAPGAHLETDNGTSAPEGYGLKPANTFVKEKGLKKVDPHLKRAFLRKSWQRLDFISSLCFWISLLLSINRYDAKHHIMLFRALSCLRILRLCNLTSGTNTILTACKSALPQLIDVSIFISFFWLFFGIIGVQSFKSSLTRHCVWTNPDDPSDTYINSDSYCGSFIGIDGSKRSYLNRDGMPSGVIKGFRCPRFSQCISGDNPHNGTVNFDNILQSLEMVFVIMSANTFTDIMYNTMDTDNMVACIFFIACIFVMTVWLLNVFIAVIVASFNVTRLETTKQQKRQGPGWKFLRRFKDDSKHYEEKIKEMEKRNRYLKFYRKFEFVFVIVIAISLFVQCFRSHDMSDHRRHLLYRFESSFTGVFLGEIIIRFILHFPQWRVFFLSKRNCFDLFLAIATTIIIIKPIKNKMGHAYYWLSVLQLMRFYRVVLATSITRNLWLKLMKNIRIIFDLALFYFILLFLVSIILARHFEGAVPNDDLDDIDFPMNTLPASFIALYIITSTENWTDIMYSMQEYAKTTSSRSFGSIFLVMWFFLSNMVILNIFIAVIANTLQVSEEGKRKRQLLQFIEVMTNKLQSVHEESGLLKKVKAKLFKRKSGRDEMEKAVVNLLLSGTAVQEFLNRDADVDIDDDDEEDAGDDMKTLSSNKWKRWIQIHTARVTNIFSNPFYFNKEKKKTKYKLENFDPSSFANNIIKERNALLTQQNKFLDANPRYNYVFYIIGPRHMVRRLCQKMVKSSHGERIDGVQPYEPVSEGIVVFTFIATVVLVVLACYMTPIYRMQNTNENWIFWSEYVFALIFTVEFAIKVLADGLIFTPNAYCLSSWNMIDMIVLISLWIEAIAYLRDDGNLSRIVRGLKALRALRLLTISETAKSNFHNTMIAGFGKIINAAIISLCLLFPFSIWGLNIFNGRLGYCIDSESTEGECINEYENEVFNWNVVSPKVYTNPQLEFNRFITSFATLFEIVSLEGWTDLLANVMKSTGIGTVPEKNATPFNGFFVVLFNFISTIFILTLFISVIISNYSRTTGRAYMTTDQISWYQIKKILVQVRPSKRKDYYSLSYFRRFCYNMTVEKNPIWFRILNCVLAFHALALLLECFPSPNTLNIFRTVAYTITSVLFFVNAVMLAIAQGLKTYLHYKWNIFNLLVSFGAVATTIIAYPVDDNSPFLNVNKLFLVAILLFVIPRSNRLSQLLRFASASLPSLISLSYTWIIVFLVFAIAMNQIFGLTRIGPNGSGNINLRSVPKTLIVLFRCSFGEGWNYIMEDYTVSTPFCTSEGGTYTDDCGSKQYAYILFIAWNLISMYIFLNMFISLILDSFDYINQKTDYSELIKREEIRKFKRAWQKFDPYGTGYIKPIDLPKFLHSLEGALSFRSYTGELEIKQLCRRWIKRNNPSDPYDVTVDFDSIDKTMNQMDIPKIRERRKAFDMFMEEALLTMELNDDPGISFTRIILQLPLYTTFDTGKCFNLIDYLDRQLLIKKVIKRMQTKRVYESIAAYACRWKYQKDRKLGIRDSNIAFDTRLRRMSYLANEDLQINTGFPQKSITDENVNSNERGSDLDSDSESDDDKFQARPPLRRSSLIYGDPGMSSGVYFPNSPLLKASNHMSPPSPSRSRKPNLSISIPHTNYEESRLLDDDITFSAFADSAAHEKPSSSSRKNSLEEMIESSRWRDALSFKHKKR
ncbi:hypothetical protein CANMA_004570 [Candida margitis]|uniref:CCH1 n=1 Tax=Candida margitis TaxID=1775924 RepID=UPI002227D018|nr:CCH1 [Candida margitis]XP_051669877.1 uncharacterized protein CANMA_004570 [Candida margitis]KAI5956123.1 CCH1 [Candida margitis]KAI5956141.1 hypothetical protein CANMA_004570 [Candida margitis]